jgi:hypothetical protein
MINPKDFIKYLDGELIEGGAEDLIVYNKLMNLVHSRLPQVYTQLDNDVFLTLAKVIKRIWEVNPEFIDDFILLYKALEHIDKKFTVHSDAIGDIYIKNILAISTIKRKKR